MKKSICIILMGAALFLLSGCIRSRVVVRSEPSGADLTINDTYRGKTPITVPFGWYWFYDFKLEKKGYKTTESRERFKAPVYFYIPFDLILEAMPFYIYDTKERSYIMEPLEQPGVDFEQEAGS